MVEKKNENREMNREKKKVHFFLRVNKRDQYYDYSLLFVILFLTVFGWIMIYSSSSYVASVDYNDSMYFLKRQIIASVLGLGAMIVISLMDYEWLKKIYVIAACVAIILIVALLFVGSTKKGATRWLPLFAGFNVQPAEVAKLAIIIFLATFIEKMKAIMDTLVGFVVLSFVPALTAVLIYVISNNASSAVIVLGIAYIMMAGASTKPGVYVGLFVAVAALAVGLVICITHLGVSTGFRSTRILAWLDPESYTSTYSYQTLQALYAIGSGGYWGKGLGASMQKLGFVPEAQNDMIFSIICEELGLFGALYVILLYIILIYQCANIARKSYDLYGALLVTGVMAHLAIQVIFNIAVITKTFPNTGVSLPFISYGGSSVVFLMMEFGIVMAVSRKNAVQLNNALRGPQLSYQKAGERL